MSNGIVLPRHRRLMEKSKMVMIADSMGKHTPSPWEVGQLDHAGQRIVRGKHIEICTCWHHSVRSIEQEMEANARLIAAAPDILGELKRMVEHFEVFASDHSMEASTETWSALHCAKAAISKAEFQPNTAALISKAEGHDNA